MTLYLRLLKYLGSYRIRLAGAIVCAAMVAALSGVYAWLVRPVLDGIFINKDSTLLMVLPLAILAVAVLKGLFNYGQNYLMNYVGFRVVTDIRQQLFEQMVRLPVSFHDANNSGRLVSRVVNDVILMSNAVSGVLKDIFQQGLTLVVMLGVVFYQNWKLATISLLVIPFSIYTMTSMGRRLRKLASFGQERIGDMASTIQETLGAIRVVKAFNREQVERERFRTHNRAVLENLMKSIQVSSLGSSHMEVIGVIGIAGIIWYGGFLVIQGDMTPGSFFSFLTAMFMAYTPIRRLSGANNTIQQAVAAAERVFMVLDLDDEHKVDRGTLTLEPGPQSIEFRRVTFRYPGHAIAALEEIDLQVAAGEVVALVGSSGSGKTTLISLVPRFYAPTSGTVLINGQDIASYTLRSLRSQIGIVSQEVVLFDDTIRNNIAYSRDGASDEEVMRAAHAAHAHEFISKLPQGYQTIVGERGLKLSGGERQRLAIARAILKDPPILILDEATSALDSESERVVQLALSNLMKNRTTLVIAHRLSTIQKADRIVVMSRGRIVESGTHEQLLAHNGTYRRLHNMQFQDSSIGAE
ncbi:MAG TPA: lipid A export permease/ATP-binding protein MsbA [Nitrospiraceae bacterium]|nr:lipid A export permease/ATP-binding protein MsbA [Nitrospiraceae bacterium]